MVCARFEPDALIEVYVPRPISVSHWGMYPAGESLRIVECYDRGPNANNQYETIFVTHMGTVTSFTSCFDVGASPTGAEMRLNHDMEVLARHLGIPSSDMRWEIQANRRGT